MKEQLTPDRVANSIRLKRQTFTGSFLLVEGGSDKRFYQRFTHENCKIEILSGKPSSKQRVIEVLQILENDNFPGVLAIVDADFDRLEYPQNSSPNLLRTDTHDLETMLLQSPALDKVIPELGSERKVEQLEKLGKSVRMALLEAGIVLGYLLWISQIDGLNLKFEGIEYSKFINEKSLVIDPQKLIQEVKNKSQFHSLPVSELHQRLHTQKSDYHDPWQVCCGHHLVEILAFALRKTIGNQKSADVKSDKLEKDLRLAYEDAYFQQTQLYIKICGWERDNENFMVLRASQ
ncbi:MAG: DUF4435 domain-containing protein [Roseofilum sp. SID2]|uniref:DUF4435 domain-containing protein n=1 Tax=unclassified Roseofilum TaxID=2620099 RepID=UPI001B0307D7|nr:MULTISPECIES: DUF4435 domain-containing protein [unclassified Roseofilum]MBP0013608.1 DUF4435 domain-containing protein [Roseofilum sp. SID3]MBP0026742.1 DUF4435 domain-containing protein [Roseofilum sp. SID2]MBP0039342.1 DUF4435 domain-containing protein [Roseofilum sp. SID1]